MKKTYEDNALFSLKGNYPKCKYQDYECDDYVIIRCNHKSPPDKISQLCIGEKCKKRITKEEAIQCEVCEKRKAKYIEEAERIKLCKPCAIVNDDLETCKKIKYYYQPEFNEKEWDKQNFYSFMVYRFKKNAQKDFPNLKIVEYSNGDIENPTFIY